ncbi:hypothetical protein Tsubulata_011836, partial [Turnera subulata]
MAGSSKLVIDLRDGDDECIPSDEASLGSLVARTNLVDKIFSDRRVTPAQVRQQLKDIWYIKGDFRVLPKQNNLFLLGFELEEDKKHVQKGSLWLVSNLHFCLKPWSQEMILSQGGKVLSGPESSLMLQNHLDQGCPKPKRPNEGIELAEENSFGPWMRAKEIFGKHYSGKRFFDVGTGEGEGEMRNTDAQVHTSEQPLPAVSPILVEKGATHPVTSSRTRQGIRSAKPAENS